MHIIDINISYKMLVGEITFCTFGALGLFWGHIMLGPSPKMPWDLRSTAPNIFGPFVRLCLRGSLNFTQKQLKQLPSGLLNMAQSK